MLQQVDLFLFIYLFDTLSTVNLKNSSWTNLNRLTKTILKWECLVSTYKVSIFSVTQLAEPPENMKWRVRFVRKANNSFAKSKTTPDFFKDFLKLDWLYYYKNVNANENARTLVVYIMSRWGTYRYTLLINIHCRNPMFDKYSLHNLRGQSIQSYFLTLPLNWTRALICLKFSAGKIDYNCWDLCLKVSWPIFTFLFLFVAKSWKLLRLYVLFLFSNIKSINGEFRLFFNL